MEENKNNVSVQSGDVSEQYTYVPDIGSSSYFVPVTFITSDGATIDNSKITTKTTCADLATDTISVSLSGKLWAVVCGKISATTENNLTVEFSLDGYEPITWSGKSVTQDSLSASTTTLTFEKIKTLSDEITRIKTAKESLRTALNTLVPKMVGDDLLLDYYGGLIDNVISTRKITVKAQTAISTEAAANTAVATARKLKQPLVVWWGSAATISQGCSNIAKLNYADCYGARFCYLSTSWTGTTFGPIDLTECPSYPCLIFIDPECPDTDPVSGVDYYAVSVDASKITKAVVQSGLGQLVTIAGRL